jgi:flagellin-like protein
MNKKSVTTNQRAVSGVIGVVVMVTIVVALAAAVNVSMSGMSSSGLDPTPFVSMIQSGDNVLIVAIQNGPIEVNGAIIYIEGSSGDPSASLNTADTYLKSGDFIKITGDVTSGEEYTISMVYSNSIVGQVVYIAP